jgi:hypothetical protein
MRALAVLMVAAAGFAAAVPTMASAAELEVGEGCARGQVWNGYRCEWPRPRVSEAPPVYQAPPVYEAEAIYEEPPVVVARPYYVAPPVYVAPIYRAPVVRYYAGPRYVYGYGRHHYQHRGHWRR